MEELHQSIGHTNQRRVEKVALGGGDTSDVRLYRRLAGRLLDLLATGRFAVGERLPAERDLAIEYNVSRPTVREAIIALEAQGLLEVRVGSGTYVRALPGPSEVPDFHVTAFELTEARLVIEGETAALAAVHITDAELAELDALVDLIADENRRGDRSEAADRGFHFLIARATRNAALQRVAEGLWHTRASSPDTAILLEKARAAKVQPVVEEHRAIARALRSRDPALARAAMRSHLAAVLDHLLFATEAVAVERVRAETDSARRRFTVSGRT
ncbi:MAG: FadR/GntR family transcriptional regulator [Sphingomonas sp.]